MKCSFCGKEIKRGTGKLLVKDDASKFYFCSSRCEKVFKMKKKSKKVPKWVKTN